MTTDTKHIEALKLALDALEPDWELAEWYVDELRNKAITAIREALAEQPAPVATPHKQQEPVAYIHRQGNHWEVSERFLLDDEKARGWTEEPLYTSPPNVPTARASKPWVGLTEEERMDVLLALNWNKQLTHMDTANAIEAKLREKTSKGQV